MGYWLMQKLHESSSVNSALARADGQRIWQTAIAFSFVILWASGFVVPRAFVAHAEPLTFVAYRNGGAALFLIAVALVLRDAWPVRRADIAGLLWSGALLQGFSVMGLYWAVYWGLPAGIAALVGGLQPALTAIVAAQIAGEALSVQQWGGIALGFAGLGIAIGPKVESAQISIVLALIALAGVACMAYASISQKRYEQSAGPWSRTALLFVGATIPASIGAALLEHLHMDWQSLPLIAVYVWSVFALAIGATMALLFLIRQGQAARAASLIYLVPPTSALMAYLGFGERLGWMQVLGFVVAGCGVAVVQFKRAK